jgi:hypothetical protein
MTMRNFNELKVGDEVGITNRRWRSPFYHTFIYGTVSKVNGFGHVFVDVKRPDGEVYQYRFNSRGDEYKKEYSSIQLIEASALRQHERAKNRQRKLDNQAKAMLELINGRRTGNGNYNLTEQMLDDLESLVHETRALL